MQIHAAPAAVLPVLLLVESDPAIAKACSAALARHFVVSLAASRSAAAARIAARPLRFVVAEVALPDGDGIDVCRMAKMSGHSMSVVLLAQDAERVPDALDAGCDSVLLKPFAPNLLVARLGRLIQAQAAAQFASRLNPVGRQLLESTLPSGTNRYWPDVPCPHCAHHGVTSFDFCSRRRMWCACPSCRHVWIDARRE